MTGATSAGLRDSFVSDILPESFYCVCPMTRDIAASERNIKYHFMAVYCGREGHSYGWILDM